MTAGKTILMIIGGILIFFLCQIAIEFALSAIKYRDIAAYWTRLPSFAYRDGFGKLSFLGVNVVAAVIAISWCQNYIKRNKLPKRETAQESRKEVKLTQDKPTKGWSNDETKKSQQKVIESTIASRHSETGKPIYAGFWIRAWSEIIDLVILFIPIGIILSNVYPGYLDEGGASKYFGFYSPLDFLLSWVTPVVYTIVFWNSKGATPGKMLTKIRIVDYKTFEQPKLGTLFGRYFGYLLSAIPLGLGYFWVGWDKEKRSFHDKMAGTAVIYIRESTENRATDVKSTSRGVPPTMERQPPVGESERRVTDVESIPPVASHHREEGPSFYIDGAEAAKQKKEWERKKRREKYRQGRPHGKVDDTSAPPSSPESKSRKKSGAPNEKSYGIAWKELEDGNVDTGLWARLLVENNGDREKTELAYLRERSERLDGLDTEQAVGPATETGKNLTEKEASRRKVDKESAKTSTPREREPKVPQDFNTVLQICADEMLKIIREYLDDADERQSNFSRIKPNISAGRINYCIEKFIDSEFDCNTSGLRGLGRAQDSPPRLGGYFRDGVKHLTSPKETEIRSQMFTLILKSYLFYILGESKRTVSKSTTGDALFEEWIPEIYMFNLADLGDIGGNLMFALVEKEFDVLKSIFKKNGMVPKRGEDKTEHILWGYVSAGLVLTLADMGLAGY